MVLLDVWASTRQTWIMFRIVSGGQTSQPSKRVLSNLDMNVSSGRASSIRIVPGRVYASSRNAFPLANCDARGDDCASILSSCSVFVCTPIPPPVLSIHLKRNHLENGLKQSLVKGLTLAHQRAFNDSRIRIQVRYSILYTPHHFLLHAPGKEH